MVAIEEEVIAQVIERIESLNKDNIRLLMQLKENKAYYLSHMRKVKEAHFRQWLYHA